MADTHWTHVVLRGNSTSTWRAAKWPAWEAILGFFRAEFEDGPKTKFAHLGLLSNFD
jgi:hypothetical protein